MLSVAAVAFSAQALIPKQLRGGGAASGATKNAPNRGLQQQEPVLLGIEHDPLYDGDRNTIPDDNFVDEVVGKIEQTDGDEGPHWDLSTDDYIHEDAGYDGVDGVLGRTTGLLYGAGEQGQADVDSVLYSELSDHDAADAVEGYNPTVVHADQAAAAAASSFAEQEGDGAYDQAARTMEDMDVFHPDAYGTGALPYVGRTSGLLPDADGNLAALEDLLRAPPPPDAQNGAGISGSSGEAHHTLFEQVSKISYAEPESDLDATDHLNADAEYGDEDLGVLGRTTGLLYGAGEEDLMEEHKLVYAEMKKDENDIEGDAYASDVMDMLNYPVDAHTEGAPELDGAPLEEELP